MLVETPPKGYANSSATANSPDQSSILAGGSSSTVNVQVTDVAGFTSVTYYDSDFYSEYGANPPSLNFYLNQNYDTTSAPSYIDEYYTYPEQLPISATYTESPGFTTGSQASPVSAYCINLVEFLDSGTNVFSTVGQEIPPALDISTTNIQNAGRIAYLYNTYAGSVASTPDATSGLQLAIWELVYNDLSGPVTASELTSPTGANSQGNNIVDLTAGPSTSSADFNSIINNAVSYINASIGQSQLALSLTATGQDQEGGDQSMIVSSTINFADQQLAQPSINTQASVSPNDVVGTAVLADSATLSGGNSPGGTISFTLTQPDGTDLQEGSVNVNGDGTYDSPNSVTATEVGNYTWHASYSGDTNNAPASDNGANEGVTIVKANSSVSTAIYDSGGGAVTGALGESVYDTATVSGTPLTPTGTVTYYFYNTSSPVYGTTTPIGSQTVTLSGGIVPGSSLEGPLTAGSYSFIGVYSGDSNYNSSVGAVEPLTVNQASSSVSTAIYDSTGGAVTGALGESVYDTATVGGTPFTPTGTVTYYFYNTSNPVYGTTAPVSTQTVNLSGGIVPNSSNTAPLTAGSDSFIGVYSGDSNYAGSVGAVEPLTVNQASSSVGTAIYDSTGGAVTGALGESVHDTATVSGTPFTPTGTVTYYFYNTSSPVYGTTAPVSTQTVTLSGGAVPNSSNTTPLTAGSDSFIGVYSGDSNYAGSVGAVEPLTVNQASSSVSTAIYDSSGGAVTGALGESVHDTATVTGTPFTPTGTVTYYFYNTSSPVYGTTAPVSTQTVTLSGGAVPNSSNTAPLAAGSDSFIGVYSGDSNYAGSVGAVEPLTVNQASSSVSTAIYDSTGGAITNALGESVHDTATVSGTPFTPTGTVTYYFYNTSSPVFGTTTPVSTQTVTLSGGAVPNSSNTAPLAAGSDAFIGVYSGDSNYAGSVGAVEPLSIHKGSSGVSTTIHDSGGGAVTGALGESVYDTATVSGTPFTPTGTVTYYFYNTSSPTYGTTTPVSTQTVTLSGGAVPNSATKGPLSSGSYSFIGVYSGDSNYAGYTGAVEPLTISLASPSICTTPGGPIALGNFTISGAKYLDLTGNGFSSDDTPQGGVTIDLYQVTNSTATLVATTTTASNGTYSFTETTPGTYEVQEVVPTGYIQTGGGPSGSAGNAYYTINATAGRSYSGYNFDDFLIPTCTPTCVSYKVTTPNNRSTTVSDLAGNTQQGDTVTVTFTVPSGMNDTLTLVSYEAPSSSFTDSNAYEQTIYQQATGTFSPGTHTLTVKIPNCDYQIDFVCGQSINELEPNQNNDAYGPDSAEILYHAEDRFISSDNSGTTCPSLPTPPAPTTPALTTTTATLSDSATLSGGSNPTGTITFYLFAPGVTPNGTDSNNVYSDTVTVSGDGTYTTATGTTPGGFAPTSAGTYEWVAVYGGNSSNKPATSPFGSEPETASVLCLSGTVYCDMNLDGKLDGSDQGIGGVTVTLSGTAANGNAVSMTTTTAANGTYSFSGMPFSNASGYTVSVTTPSGDFSGSATAGSFGGTVSTSPEGVTSILMSTTSQANGTGYNLGLVMPSSLSGQVYDDGTGDRCHDSSDQGLSGVTVTLTGQNYQGSSVKLTAVTNGSGNYSFSGLAPGTYTVTVTPPGGFTADADSVGTVGGKAEGNAISDAAIASIVLEGCTSAGINYDFSLVGSGTSTCQTQSSSYWCGSQGQSLIKCLNGGSSQTGLGNWLAATCPNLFGGLKGCSNSQVASYCKTLSGGNANQQACGQVLATALCAYVTDSNLGGNAGASYGFTVTANGLGSSTWNVGTNGSGVGLSNHQSYSILALLQQVDGQSKNGALNSSASGGAGSLFSSINQYCCSWRRGQEARAARSGARRQGLRGTPPDDALIADRRATGRSNGARPGIRAAADCTR